MVDDRTDGLYAHVETEFVRGFQFLSLPVGARMLYIGLWCYALSQRRETIARPPNDYLARVTGLQRHPITTYLSRLHDSQLLFITPGTITVIGLRKKHNKITFKSDLEISPEFLKNLEIPSSLSNPIQSVPKQSNPPIPPPGDGGEVKPSPSNPWDFADKLESWKAAYPRIQVDQEIARCRAWWDANPEKVRGRKRPDGTVVNWLGRANERAPAVMDTDQDGNFWDGARWWTPDEYSASMNMRYIEDGISDATRATMATRPWDKPRPGGEGVAQSAGGNPPVGGTEGEDRVGGILESPGGLGEVKGAGGLGA